MLLDRAAERRVMEITQAVVSSFSVFAIGRELGQTVVESVSSALGLTAAGRLTFLESSYIAGKAASILGTDALRRMTEAELVTWITTNNITLTAADRIVIGQMKSNTERWLQGRSEAWQVRLRGEMAIADTAWRATLQSTTFADAGALAAARSSALRNLLNRMSDSSELWQADIDRLVQSEMNAYFQTGQVALVSGDELVYKVPRGSACPHCLRICVNTNGTFKRFRLDDVRGNSNVGTPAIAWQFTIGPIHPYCYCVLYREEDKDLGASEALARAKAESLGKSLTKNSCGISDDPDLLFEEQEGDHDHSPRPAHYTAMINAVKKTYGDSLPRLPDE